MPSKQVIALAQRITDEFGIYADPNTFQRTYAGHWLRAGGAYTWIMRGTKDSVYTIGGFEPIRKYIVKRNKLQMQVEHFHDYCVYATAPDEPGYNKIKVGEIIGR